MYSNKKLSNPCPFLILFSLSPCSTLSDSPKEGLWPYFMPTLSLYNSFTLISLSAMGVFKFIFPLVHPPQLLWSSLSWGYPFGNHSYHSKGTKTTFHTINRHTNHARCSKQFCYSYFIVIYIHMCSCEYEYIFNIYLYICMCAKLLQFCLTLCDPKDYSPLGS